jgi:uncharacterized protein YdiU (UPF0061 family)
LKGSGPTPFSRRGDGRSALGPVLREYLVSEAMHALGVPTTRALAAVASGEKVFREGMVPGGVFTRVARSHIRVGTFQWFAARQEFENIRILADYSIDRHYPGARQTDNPYLALLEGLIERQADLIARWMQFGFIHGVMNTDNFSVSGETIDYGPCAFMEAYDPETVFSSIDSHGRYAFGNQPAIGRWNLTRMGEALLALLAEERELAIERVREALDLYQRTVQGALLDGMRKKLGLVGADEQDEALVVDLLEWMHQAKQDYTLAFRALAGGLVEGAPPFPDEMFLLWHSRYRQRLGEQPADEVAQNMNRVNPLYIARNHLVEAALDAAIEGDLDPFREMLQVLARPYDEQSSRSRYAEAAPADFGPYRTFCGT